MRHPSIGSKRKGRQKEANSETHSKRYSSIFSLSSSMQYLSSFARHPRAGSTTGTVPVVIVTPSSPTRAVAEPLPPSSSSPSILELTDATVEPSLHLTQSTSVFEDTGEVSLTSVKQDPIPPDVESDISVIEFDSWTMSAPQEATASEPSFFLSESLQKITFKPIRCASHALSAVSDTLYDAPAAEAPGVGIMPSYFTSTPPKRGRSTGTKLRDIENNHVEAIAPLELPNHDAFYQYVDHLIPYPDVFDLDMYYNNSIPLRKKLQRLYNRDCTFENTFSLQSGDLIDPPLSEKLPLDDYKGKYGMATSSVTVISSPVEHKHDFGSCRDIISQSPSTHSLLKSNSSPSKSQEQHRIPPHNSVNPRYIKPLNESTNNNNMSFKTSGTTSPSSTMYSIDDKSPSTRVKSQRQIHSLPASAHDQRSRSIYCPQRSRTSSDSESDAGSMDALRARLREACDITNSSSVSTHTEEMEIWEPVSF